MKRFTHESNQPMHIYDDKTGKWYDPHNPTTVNSLINIANQLQEQNDMLMELLQEVNQDKLSLRKKTRKRIRKLIEQSQNFK